MFLGGIMPFGGKFQYRVMGTEEFGGCCAECKADKTIDKSVVTNKDPKTKKVYKIVSSFVVEGHAALQQEIKSAFERDKEEAYQVIENENDGVVSWFIRFSKGKNTVSYSINVDEEELLLTVIENFDMPEGKDIEIRSSSDM